MSERLFDICQKVVSGLRGEYGDLGIDPDDLRSDLYVKLLPHESKVEMMDSYAYRAGRRLLIDVWKARDARRRHLQHLPPPIVDDTTAAPELEADLEALSRELDDREREVYQVLLLDVTDRQAAAILGVTVPAWKARKCRFRKKWGYWCI